MFGGTSEGLRGTSEVFRGTSNVFPAPADHLVMTKNVQNVRVDPGRVRLDLELYLGAWRWLGSQVCIFSGQKYLFLVFYDTYAVCGVQEMCLEAGEIRYGAEEIYFGVEEIFSKSGF